jgi:hypothetical protein
MDPNVIKSSGPDSSQQMSPLPEAPVKTQGFLGGRFCTRLKVSSNPSRKKQTETV